MKKEKQQKDGIEQLQQIRSMMEESSKFISLSGLSGIMAGITALAGSAYGYFIIKNTARHSRYNKFYFNLDGMDTSVFWELLIAASITLLVAVCFGVVLTIRKTKKKGQKIWSSTGKRLLINLLIPLVAGGVFSLILAYHKIFGLIAPVTLIFYGLALLNASKYTLTDIRNLGLLEIVLGLISAFFVGYGILFWAIGFGILHIIYGSLMHFKYDRA